MCRESCRDKVFPFSAMKSSSLGLCPKRLSEQRVSLVVCPGSQPLVPGDSSTSQVAVTSSGRRPARCRNRRSPSALPTCLRLFGLAHAFAAAQATDVLLQPPLSVASSSVRKGLMPVSSSSVNITDSSAWLRLPRPMLEKATTERVSPSRLRGASLVPIIVGADSAVAAPPSSASIAAASSHLARKKGDSDPSTNLVVGEAMDVAHSSTWQLPRVFFLFMVYETLDNEDFWAAFFETAPDPNMWRAFVHVKGNSKGLGSTPLFQYTFVETVPSEYCKDLVSPMVQLLRTATAESFSPGDKFVFVSETTLPIKRFPQVYKALTMDTDSDFCMNTRDSWSELMSQRTGKSALIVKHSQWVVLSQAHARVMVERWPSVKQHANYWNLPVWPKAAAAEYGPSDFALVSRGVSLCADEWAIFATIYGTLLINSKELTVSLPGNSAMNLNVAGPLANTNQGKCQTFVTWGWTASKRSYTIAADIVSDMPKSSFSCFPHCTGSSPATFQSISDRGLSVLLESTYLFARKFPKNVVSLEQFRRVVLSTGNLHPSLGVVSAQGCPAGCGAAQCANGDPSNGGMPLIGSLCHSRCSVFFGGDVSSGGSRYCGVGGAYDSAGSVDCTACGQTR
eukprot:TRINITY_DN45312_c0_g1_i1.p1 TRINITY_DN45312_c0_g1~~TRINITY_DN45312_c0_g1_i1.p1  ORF type:complete len:622 (-),score=71.22 TRINITY_DN45312_c0_g1_i1:51-1916(-)